MASASAPFWLAVFFRIWLKHANALHFHFLCFTPPIVPPLKHDNGLLWQILCFNVTPLHRKIAGLRGMLWFVACSGRHVWRKPMATLGRVRGRGPKLARSAGAWEGRGAQRRGFAHTCLPEHPHHAVHAQPDGAHLGPQVNHGHYHGQFQKKKQRSHSG